MTLIESALNIQPEKSRPRCGLPEFTHRSTCAYPRIQALRGRITNTRSALSVSSLSKHGAATELEDLLRTRTELECVIADLELAGEKGETQRTTIQQDLHNIQMRIEDVKTALSEVVPEWEAHVGAEKEERARCVTHYFSRSPHLFLS